MASEAWIAPALIVTIIDLAVIAICLAKFTDRALDGTGRPLRFSLMSLFIATTLIAFHAAILAWLFRPFF